MKIKGRMHFFFLKVNVFQILKGLNKQKIEEFDIIKE